MYSGNLYADNDFPLTGMEKEKEEDGYELDPIGRIRNEGGKCYIESDNPFEYGNGYVKVIWWFHKFDKKEFRRATECNPPYEKAPRSGIFATRSPVRPNPIAMSVVRVIGKSDDGKKLFLNSMECFDQTPCVAVLPYFSSDDRVTEVHVPEWLEHWPKCIEGSDGSVRKSESIEGEICLHDSPVVPMLYHEMTGVSAVQNMENSFVSSKDGISLHGGRENNLKNITVRIPYGKITAVVGVSGSGKSSLVQDTIYAECRRRMEYLNKDSHILAKPEMESMSGCIPTVMISQRPIGANIHSTVGTYTDAYRRLRSIYAQVGLRHCPDCGHEILPLTKTQICDLLKEEKEAEISDAVSGKMGEESSQATGRVYRDGTLEERVEAALAGGKGALRVTVPGKEPYLLQTKQKCYRCDKLLFELTPTTFSFLDPESRCPICNGTGMVTRVEEEKLIEKPELSVLEGASSFWGKLRTFIEKPNANWMKGQVIGLAEKRGVDLSLPWKQLPEKFRNELLYGVDEEVTFSYHNHNGRNGEITRPVEGVCAIIERLLTDHPDSKQLLKYLTSVPCMTCRGERLNREGRSVTIRNIRYPEAAMMDFDTMREFCLALPGYLGNEMYEQIRANTEGLLEICEAAKTLGIEYLKLSTGTGEISGGEAQRLKLLSVIQNHMTGILYVFDEPTKGLHPSDYKRLLHVFEQMKSEGNTILMVEHNEDMIQKADYLIEIGPKAGKEGGYLVGEGDWDKMLASKETQTSRFLNGKERPRIIVEKNKNSFHYIEMNKLNYHNLKDIDIRFPKNALTCICGVSGSGKSSLMKGEIFPKMTKNKNFSEVVLVDQSEIGRSSRSVLATYLGIMDGIREVLAKTEDAIELGMDSSYFSFNGGAGQCENCSGEGRIKLPYLEDAWVKCPKCHGGRYGKEVIKVCYQGKNVVELLSMSVSEAMDFWRETPLISSKLSILNEVGMGYLKLGQSTATLSGGEASRLKLAKKLMDRKNTNVLYLFDEPTTGLHFSDIEALLYLIQKLLEEGNTVIAIEHNRQFLDNADWVLEMGPAAGDAGGYCVEMR